MAQTLIKWKLREIMFRHDIKAVDLSKEMGLSANAISHLRKDRMPKIDGDRLDLLCKSLTKLANGEKIRALDLIEQTDE